jgi:Fe-S-cluster containining protein
MLRESMCDTCLAPGHCCRSLMLGGGSFARNLDTVEEVERELRNEGEGRYAGNPMPFKVLFRRSDNIWVFWCPKLDQPTGRCTDYENRPHCCSSYDPGTDGLCVHWPDPDKEQAKC